VLVADIGRGVYGHKSTGASRIHRKEPWRGGGGGRWLQDIERGGQPLAIAAIGPVWYWDEMVRIASEGCGILGDMYAACGYAFVTIALALGFAWPAAATQGGGQGGVVCAPSPGGGHQLSERPPPRPFRDELPWLATGMSPEAVARILGRCVDGPAQSQGPQAPAVQPRPQTPSR